MIKSLFQNLLVAYNGSQSSLHALLYAVMMAKIYKCHLKVVYVVDTDTIKKLTLTKFMIREEGNAIEKGLEADGRRNLDYAKSVAKEKGIKIEVELRKGAVWAEIITCSEEYNADLLLLGGSFGSKSGPVKRDILSVQESHILANAPCPAMVVHKAQIEQLFKLA